MLKKCLKLTLIVVLIAMLVLLLARFVFVESVTVTNRGVAYINNYDKFYLYKKYKNTRPFIDFGEGSASGYKIWILRTQKAKLLKEMRKDIDEELSDVVKNNDDIFQGFKISDDYKKVFIYIYKNAKEPDGLDLDAKVSARIELYYQFIHGSGNVVFESDIVNFIMVEK